MSVLLDNRNLTLGNGDLFLGSTVGNVPSMTAYKAALSGGTLKTINGNVGGIKGTVDLQIVRETIHLELGVPQEVVDIQCIREGVHLKCSLVELNLGTVFDQIGGGNYSQLSAGSTAVTNELDTLHIDSTNTIPESTALQKDPLIFTTSTPAAAANPFVTDPTTTTSTDTGGTGLDSNNATTINLVNTAGMVDGGLLLIGTYANGAAAAALEQITIGHVQSSTQLTGCTRGANGTTAIAHAAGTLVSILYVHRTDYEFTALLNTIFPVEGGRLFTLAAANDSAYAVNVTYYYNQLAQELLTVGGQSIINFTVARFFHPYAWGGALMFTGFKMAPTGTTTVPFEETNYSHMVFELRGLADFTQVQGSHIFSILRDRPT